VKPVKNGGGVIGRTTPPASYFSDTLNICDWCEYFYGENGTPVKAGSINRTVIFSVLNQMETILSRSFGCNAPSVFKRAAAITIAFIVLSPLKKPLSGGKLNKQLAGIKNHQNAIIPFEYCRFNLHGAKINKTDPSNPKLKKTIQLKKPIKISGHYYWDLIHFLSAIDCRAYNDGVGEVVRRGSDSETDKKLIPIIHSLALLYESLCYKANSKASYPENF